MPAFVIDSSLAVAWCFPDEHTDYANAILRAISTPLEAIAPRLWAYEVRNAVLMGVRRKRITRVAALEFLKSISELPIRLADPVSYDTVFNLADRNGLTVYDAAYLELAIREDLPLASLDNALCEAARRSGGCTVPAVVGPEITAASRGVGFGGRPGAETPLVQLLRSDR
jgi:predicted nucleic acid-binding protein